MTEGRRRAARSGATSRRRLLLVVLLVLGVVASSGAWYYLVRAAIDFGRVARNGGQGPLAWAFTAAATVGATVCLLLVFTLLARLGSALGLVSDYKPRRSAGRHTR